MNANDKVCKGVQMLKETGHQIEARIRFNKMAWKIDDRILATPEEIEHLANGIYTLSELEELHVKRRAEE